MKNLGQFNWKQAEKVTRRLEKFASLNFDEHPVLYALPVRSPPGPAPIVAAMFLLPREQNFQGKVGMSRQTAQENQLVKYLQQLGRRGERLRAISRVPERSNWTRIFSTGIVVTNRMG